MNTKLISEIRRILKNLKSKFKTHLLYPFFPVFKKVKTEHTIMDEFHAWLRAIEVHPAIQRIIPGRISRQQSGRAERRVNYSYPTSTWLKYKMCKWSTAQELFVIIEKGTEEEVKQRIQSHIEQLSV
jgi:hypothetical protein